MAQHFLPPSHSNLLSVFLHSHRCLQIKHYANCLYPALSSFLFFHRFRSVFFSPSNLSFQVPKEQITVDALPIESSLVMPGMDLEAQAVSKSIWTFLN